jgi:nitroreductase
MRALRLVYLEAGHLAQILITEAARIGIKSCPISGFDETIFEEIIADGSSTSFPLYILAVGRDHDSK